MDLRGLRIFPTISRKAETLLDTDCFFISLKIAEKLSDISTAIMATMDRSRNEIPDLLKGSKGQNYKKACYRKMKMKSASLQYIK